MSANNETPGSQPNPDEPKRVVCGLCKELLPGTFPDQVAAEEAADEHDEAEHPDRGHVVVVPISTDLVAAEGADGVVELAKGAQQRLDEGDIGESLLG